MKEAMRWLLFQIVSLLSHLIHMFVHDRRVRRSLWAGTPILNMAVNARAERLLGVRADSLVYEAYYVTSRFTYDLSRWMRVPVLRGLLPYIVLLWASVKYQRFHFYCDRGLLQSPQPFHFNERELRLLRSLGKQVFCWAYGADVRTTARTQSLGRFNCCTYCPSPGRMCICDDARGDASYQVIRRHADAVFSMGDMIHYTPGSINDVYYWPVDLQSEGGWRYAPAFPAANSSAPLRVVHAANHRPFKGTQHIINAVERLRAAGEAIELVLVERMSNDEALKVYRSADVIVDQCLIGFHGYFANEAMALGKPVICFMRDPQAYVLDAAACPIISASPPELESVLRELIHDRARLRELGMRGRAYIERYHTPQKFAERLRRAYEAIGVTS